MRQKTQTHIAASAKCRFFAARSSPYILWHVTATCAHHYMPLQVTDVSSFVLRLNEVALLDGASGQRQPSREFAAEFAAEGPA